MTLQNIRILNDYPLAKELNWEIQQEPIYTADGLMIDNHKRIYNDATGETISIMKGSYNPVKNERILEMVDNITKDSNFILEGFATFKGGKKVMAYLRNEKPLKAVGLKTENFLVIGNGNDGTVPFFSGMTDYVYRCENMFSKFNQQNKVRHTKFSENMIKTNESVINMYYNNVTGIYEQYERMSDFKIDSDTKSKFIHHLLESNYETKTEVSKQKERKIEQLLGSIDRETKDLGNNAFGLFNAATHFTTHIMNHKNRIFGNPFSTANTINQRAYEFCTDLVKN